MRKALLYLPLAAALMLCTACFDDNGTTVDDPDSFDDGNADYTTGLLAYYTFDNSDGSDASGNGRDAFFYGEPRFVQGRRGTGVFLNSFREEYLNIPYNFFEGSVRWSVSFWIKDFGAGNIFGAQNSSSGSSVGDAPLFWAKEDNTFRLKCTSGEVEYDNGTDFTYNNNAIQSDGNWHHVVVTIWKNSGYGSVVKARLFVDGSLRDETSCRIKPDCIDNCAKIVFGGDKDGRYNYKSSMKLDEVRFYDRALATAAVRALYESGQ